MNKLEKWMMDKSPKYKQRCEDYTERCKYLTLFAQEICKSLKIYETLNWLNNLLRRLK